MQKAKILYIQFADPAAYPPIEHSSTILAEQGWEVVLLGTAAFGDATLRLAKHAGIAMKNLPRARRRPLQRLQYLIFPFWALGWVIVWRPSWIYASDPLVLPTLWLIGKITRTRIIYHEHDSPDQAAANSRLVRVLFWFRKAIATRAELCVLPQQQRLAQFVVETGRDGPTCCVWNCPRQGEIQVAPAPHRDRLVLYYHGSINRARLPLAVITAVSRFKGAIELRVAGYETEGSYGYVDEMKALAERSNVPSMLAFLGTVPFREDLLAHASQADIGLSFMPRKSDDINLRHMLGASNKPFDYMACGLPLLVTDIDEWERTFVRPGFGRACDPEDPASVEAELDWYLQHPTEREAMSRRCREKIELEWNYEAAFAPVLERMQAAELEGKAAQRRSES
jgi:glycosyltransferase involved in cell wall biosynthesis